MKMETFIPSTNRYVLANLSLRICDQSYSKVVAKRLAYAALNMAYGRREYPLQGPFPTQIKWHEERIVVSFDQQFVHIRSNYSGFYICQEKDFQNCKTVEDKFDNESTWQLVHSGRVTFNPHLGRVIVETPKGRKVTGLAYLWEDSPLGKPYSLPIYAKKGNYSLPAAPFQLELKNTINKLQ